MEAEERKCPCGKSFTLLRRGRGFSRRTLCVDCQNLRLIPDKICDICQKPIEKVLGRKRRGTSHPECREEKTDILTIDSSDKERELLEAAGKKRADDLMSQLEIRGQALWQQKDWK